MAFGNPCATALAAFDIIINRKDLSLKTLAARRKIWKISETFSQKSRGEVWLLSGQNRKLFEYIFKKPSGRIKFSDLKVLSSEN
jgi:hypothetical protein